MTETKMWTDKDQNVSSITNEADGGGEGGDDLECTETIAFLTPSPRVRP
jgi:hypothetical protein